MVIISLASFRKESRFRLAGDLQKPDGVFLVWLFFPFLLFIFIDKFWSPIFSIERYIGFIHIPLFLLVAKGISKLKRAGYIAAILFIFFAFNHCLYSYYLKKDKMQRQHWRAVFDSIKEKSAPGSAVLTYISAYYFDCYSVNLPILDVDNSQHTYEGKYYENIFVVDKKEWNLLNIALPNYLFLKEWDDGLLNIKWYRRK